jgi:hypothetical protein
MELTSENVEKVLLKCLFKDGEDTSNAKIVHGVMMNVGFHPERLEENKADIIDMLSQCHPNFMSNSESKGWSFLMFCQDKNENQWTGLHSMCDNLICLGMAIDKVKFMLPRELWVALPGGVPYLQIINE